jgi:hypothetical protein
MSKKLPPLKRIVLEKRKTTMNEIDNFIDIFEWITYDIDQNYTLNKDSKGNFYVNKLYIEPNYLTYKTECASIKDGLFEQVEELYQLLHKK